MICEEYFVVALNELIEVKGISPDAAGATFGSWLGLPRWVLRNPG